MCASTCCRGEYYIISIPQDSLSVICKIARNLKNICPEGKYPALARRRSASQLSVRSFPQFTTRNADTATLHCHTVTLPTATLRQDRGTIAIHISIIPSYFILLVHLTCHLSSFSEPTDYSGAQRHGHSGKFSSTIHLAIFANLFLAFSLLIGRFDFLTSLTLRLCALIQKRHCLCLKTPGTVWLSNNCQYW